jgi:hypothetical protein
MLAALVSFWHHTPASRRFTHSGVAGASHGSAPRRLASRPTNVDEQLVGRSSVAINTNLSTGQILESPHVLVGTVDQMVETLQERRERYGISYITVFGDIDAFSPVVARGTV